MRLLGIGKLQGLILILCLCATAFAYLIARDYAFQRREIAFEALANDNQQALFNRLAKFEQALIGATAYIDGSESVSFSEWRDYVEGVDIPNQLSGMRGLGLILPVSNDNLASYLDAMRQNPPIPFEIHPETGIPEKYVISLIEPLGPNEAALGLDIAFETGRRQTAEWTRDNGAAALTPPIQLVQEADQSIGFLLLRPRYTRGAPTGTVDERRAALAGWVYAPLRADLLLADMSANQDKLFTLVVDDVNGASDVPHIFRSLPPGEEAGLMRIEKTLSVFGRDWRVLWQSTPTFDRSYGQLGSWSILLAGALLTSLFYVFFNKQNQQDQLIAQLVREKSALLDASEDRNRSIVENALVPIVILEESGDIVAANPAAEKLFNMSSDRLVGRSLSQFLIDDVDLAGESAITVRGHTADGEELFLNVQQRGWQTGDGRLRQTVVLRDVTADTRNATALAESERRWTLALAGAHIGVFDINLKTGKSIVSETWRDLMGVSRDAIELDTQREFMSRIHPDDLPALLASDRDCIAGRSARSLSEFRVRFPGNTWRWMRSDAVIAERDAEGRAVRMLGAQTDVTQLKEALEHLRHSEDRFRLVLSHAPVGMAVIDAEGRFLEINTAIATLTGYSEDDLRKARFADLFTAEDASAILAKIAKGSDGDDAVYRHEHQVRTSSGEPRWGLVKISSAFDSYAQSDIFIVQIHDITKQREMERLKSEFVATVSHELRTPLTSIKGALGLINHNAPDAFSPQTSRLLEIASINTDRLIFLVNDILDQEKISAGKIDFIIEEADPAALLRNAVLGIKPFADKLDVEVAADTDAAPARVRTDLRRTEQVLANLLSNACKFTPKGTSVTARVSQSGHFARFSVTDCGPGIPADFRPRLFEAFSQADGSDTRRLGGTGLGLNISKQIVERLGGEIGFDSEPGGLTTFWFTCPLAQEAGGEVKSKILA